jgi:prepilin-type N-terminal cleavage/methylation domain-containing protein
MRRQPTMPSIIAVMTPVRSARPLVATTVSQAEFQGARADGFTLVEMLIVLVIIAILAGLTLPHIRGHTESIAIKAAGYQLVQDLSLARQKAVSQRGTVAVVFLTDAVFDPLQVNPNLPTLSNDEKADILRLQGGIFTHYALYGFRKVGEQPGRASGGYLTEWKALPEKTFFPTNNDFTILRLPNARFPFPFSSSTNKPALPYIAFDHEGRLIEGVDTRTGLGTYRNEAITNSIARGAVFYARNPADGVITTVELQEIPPNNGLDTRVVVDAATGRAKREELEVR